MANAAKLENGVKTKYTEYDQLTTIERDDLIVDEGTIIYNTDDNEAQIYNGSSWDSIGGSGGSEITYKTITNGYDVIPTDGNNVILFYDGGTDITINVNLDTTEGFTDNILVTTYTNGIGRIKVAYELGVTGEAVQTTPTGRSFSLSRMGADTWIPFGEFEAYTPSFDSDAQAYIDAHTNISASDQIVVNQLFLDLKSFGVYSKIKANHLHVWGSAGDDKWNLVNPVDSDAAFRLTYSGLLTHFNTGTLSDGTTGYADTHYNSVTELDSTDDLTLMVWKEGTETLGTTRVYLGSEIGSARNFVGLLSGGSEDSLSIAGSGSGDYTPATPQSQQTGLIGGTVDGNRDLEYYTNGVGEGTTNTQGGSFNNQNYYVFANNNSGTATQFMQDSALKMSLIAEGLTPAEMAGLYIAYNTLFNNLTF